jgi:hypothetical protein
LLQSQILAENKTLDVQTASTIIEGLPEIKDMTVLKRNSTYKIIEM